MNTDKLIEKVKELKSKLKIDNYGYHDFEEIMNFHKDVAKLLNPVLDRLIELKENSPDVIEFCELTELIQEVRYYERKEIRLPK